MSITDELRKWAEDNTLQDRVLTTYPPQHAVHGVLETLLAIADHIDAEHEAKVSYWQGASYKDGYDEGFASADDWFGQHESNMAEHGWARLPKDADGEYIHIGDRMENNERVVRIVLTDGSWEPSVYIEKLPNVLHEHFCHEIGHYHAPTVEDVLAEFANRVCNSGHQWGLDAADTIAEYAAKLRLAGEDA